MSDSRYKVRLHSGRIEGPLAIAQIKELIVSSQLRGDEDARLYPSGSWQKVSHIPELASLFLERIEKGTQVFLRSEVESQGPSPGEPTKKLQASPASLWDNPVVTAVNAPIDAVTEAAQNATIESPKDEPRDHSTEDGEATLLASKEELRDETVPEETLMTEVTIAHSESDEPEPEPFPFAHEETVMLDRGRGEHSVSPPHSEARKKRSKTRWVLIILCALYLLTEVLDAYGPGGTQPRPEPQNVRASLPVLANETPDPQVSDKFLQQAVKSFAEDRVSSYIEAEKALQKAIQSNPENVKALALLAATYVRLIDVSNKDEKYFAVIQKLIDLSRAKEVDLLETVIADVEMYLALGQVDAAEGRLNEFQKVSRGFDEFVFYYYVAETYFKKKYLREATGFLNQIPENKIFSPRVYYLRGKVAESFELPQEAKRQYEAALARWPNHARSRLALVEINQAQARLKESQEHLQRLTKQSRDLTDSEQAQVLFLKARLKLLSGEAKEALPFLARAVDLRPNHAPYLLEYYSVRAKVGKGESSDSNAARLFYFLEAGIKEQSAGRYDEALSFFLQARQENLNSPLPLRRLGELFASRGDHKNAAINLDKAAELDPKHRETLALLARSLIESYDWDNAMKRINQLKALPNGQSQVDRLLGDLYFKQRQFQEAIVSYRKAMSRTAIDSEVYGAYANVLRAVGDSKNAIFFYTLALRFKPLEMDLIVARAHAIADDEDPSKGVISLQEVLQSLQQPRVELIFGIAELHAKARSWDLAKEYIQQAIDLDPKFAPPFRLRALILLETKGLTKETADEVLESYASYSDRNPSDPSGYLERFKIFVSLTRFPEADGELEKIYAIYPKYPNLHYFKGVLYSKMGNRTVAVEEFKKELESHPGNADAMLELGKVLQSEGQLKEALDYFSQAKIIKPDLAEAHMEAGYTNFLMKNFAGAIALLQKASSLDEGNPLIFKRLGEVYRALGNQTEAARAFRRYLQLAPDAPDRLEVQRFL